VQWFDEGNKLLLADTAAAIEWHADRSRSGVARNGVDSFRVSTHRQRQLVAACELVLEGLYAQNKISRNEEGGYSAVTKARKIVAA
jgi:hypothetical protein